MSGLAEAGKARLRIMRFLLGGPGRVREGAIAGTLLLEDKNGRTTSLDQARLVELLCDGIVVREGENIVLSAAARASVSRGDDAKRRRSMDAVALEVNGEMSQAIVNLSESPLGHLMRRKSKDGTPFLSRAEFEAGERLRADYTRGQLMPRLGANWMASVASGRRGGVGGAVELTDAALAARLRVERAIVAVGPELSGVLIDVCCFLKGLELVESERGWPVRSAKIVLKSALGVLSRHYRPQSTSRHHEPPPVLHWGSGDYRPEII
jgi:hypothetical protein